MRPHIDASEFGSITVDGRVYEHDIIIRLDGQVKKRKKKLSKRVYGTSHTISREEAEYIYERGAEWLIIGTGQYDNVRLSPKAEAFFADAGCRITLLATPQALSAWNAAQGKGIALFHVTC